MGNFCCCFNNLLHGEGGGAYTHRNEIYYKNEKYYRNNKSYNKPLYNKFS